MRGRFLEEWPLTSPLTDVKYSKDPLGSALIVLEPSCQLAGQTSPCSSCTCRMSIERRISCQATRTTYCELESFNEPNGFIDGTTNRQIVHGDLPGIFLKNLESPELLVNTGEIPHLKILLGSMMNKPRNAMPSSSFRTPYSREIFMFLSATRGSLRSGPRPPSFRGWFAQE